MLNLRECVRRAGAWRLVALGLAALAVLGCSSSSGRFPVTGTVTFRGKPVEEGTITFEDTAAGQVNSSPLAAGGGYSLELPPGDFGVSVSPPLVDRPGTGDSPGDQVPKAVANIPRKYWTQERSGLSAKVDRGNTAFNFDLQP